MRSKKLPLIRVGLLVAVSPIIAAFLYSLINGGSMFDEGSGGGTYLWFLMASMPLGLLLILVGLIAMVYRKFNSQDGTQK
jgi:uncharacterized membrane protein